MLDLTIPSQEDEAEIVGPVKQTKDTLLATFEILEKGVISFNPAIAKWSKPVISKKVIAPYFFSLFIDRRPLPPPWNDALFWLPSPAYSLHARPFRPKARKQYSRVALFESDDLKDQDFPLVLLKEDPSRVKTKSIKLLTWPIDCHRFDGESIWKLPEPAYHNQIHYVFDLAFASLMLLLPKLQPIALASNCTIYFIFGILWTCFRQTRGGTAKIKIPRQFSLPIDTKTLFQSLDANYFKPDIISIPNTNWSAYTSFAKSFYNLLATSYKEQSLLMEDPSQNYDDILFPDLEGEIPQSFQRITGCNDVIRMNVALNYPLHYVVDGF